MSGDTIVALLREGFTSGDTPGPVSSYPVGWLGTNIETANFANYANLKRIGVIGGL
jgi:hypothetical protein